MHFPSMGMAFPESALTLYCGLRAPGRSRRHLAAGGSLPMGLVPSVLGFASRGACGSPHPHPTYSEPLGTGCALPSLLMPLFCLTSTWKEARFLEASGFSVVPAFHLVTPVCLLSGKARRFWLPLLLSVAPRQRAGSSGTGGVRMPWCRGSEY